MTTMVQSAKFNFSEAPLNEGFHEENVMLAFDMELRVGVLKNHVGFNGKDCQGLNTQGHIGEGAWKTCFQAKVFCGYSDQRSYGCHTLSLGN